MTDTSNHDAVSKEEFLSQIIYLTMIKKQAKTLCVTFTVYFNIPGTIRIRTIRTLTRIYRLLEISWKLSNIHYTVFKFKFQNAYETLASGKLVFHTVTSL